MNRGSVMDELDPILTQLRAYRLKIRMSQEELAIRAGVDPSRVAQWERGANNVSLSTLRRWTDALGVDVVVKPKRRRSG